MFIEISLRLLSWDKQKNREKKYLSSNFRENEIQTEEERKYE